MKKPILNAGFRTRTWTVNVLVDVKYLLKQFGKTGTCSSPNGGGSYWKDHVYMVATSDDTTDNRVARGNGDTGSSALSIPTQAGESIQWTVSCMDSFYGTSQDEFRYAVAIYDFQKGSNWDDNLTEPSSPVEEIFNAYIKKGFGTCTLTHGGGVSNTSVPSTSVKAQAKAKASVSYYLKLVVYKISATGVQTPIGYYKVDPTIVING